MKGGQGLSYRATASPALLNVETEDGFVQFCFDKPDLIRIRGKKVELQFCGRIQPEEIALDCLDGTYQISYERIGEFLFVPLKGKASFVREQKSNGHTDFTFSILPDKDGVLKYVSTILDHAYGYHLPIVPSRIVLRKSKGILKTGMPCTLKSFRITSIPSVSRFMGYGFVM